jgi:hypothetical protein
MTFWNPTTTITIAGNNLTSYTLQGLTINLGRSDITQQSYAGFCQLVLRDCPTDLININDEIQISLDTTNATVPIFTGFITDLNSAIVASSANVKVVDLSINAVSVLSKLAAGFANNKGYALEKDGTRMLNVISELIGTQWQQLNSSQTWNDYTTQTWNDLLGVDVSEVDTPGTFDLYAVIADPQEGLGYAQIVANSGMGQLYENADGSIGYADQDRRADYYSLNGATTLDSNYILSDGITINKSKYNVVNNVDVSYGDPSATLNAFDANSIAQYGLGSSSVQTFLEDTVDAQTTADRIILLNREPAAKLEGISLLLENDAITDADRDALIQIFFGQPFEIVGLPSLLYSGAFLGYLEGWSWTINRKGAKLDLTLSDIAYSASLVEWQDVSAAEAWNTLSNTLTWVDATLGVA